MEAVSRRAHWLPQVRLAGVIASLTAAGAGAQAPPSLTATRDLHIDAAAANFSSAGSILVARNGDILVIDDKDNIFRTFNASGPTGTIGRVGEGPGEFKNLRAAGWLGDSLWTYDPNLKRVSIFAPNRKFVRSYRAPATIAAPNAPADSTAIEPYLQAVLADGSLRMLVTFRPGHAPAWAAGLDSGSSLEVRTTPSGMLKNRIAIMPPYRCSVTATHPGGTWATQIPFCNDRLHTDWGETPTRLVALVDLEPANAKSPSYRVRLVNESGTALFNKTYSFVPIAVPRSAIDSAAAALEKRTARLGPDYLAFARKVAPAHDYPPIRRIVGGLDGTTWLEEQVTRPGHFWRILDQKGNVIGIVVLPQEISLQAADLQTIWGYETDADGLQGLVRYHLDRAK